MASKREINGKAVRDEIKLLMASLLMGETGFETIDIHSGGFETRNNKMVTITHFNLKQTEQNYLIAHFMIHSRYQWGLRVSHLEGDSAHFGKTYGLTKIPE